MGSILIGIAGLIIVLLVSFLMSNNKKNINYKAVGIMIGLQLLFTWAILGTSIGLKIIGWISDIFGYLVIYANEGVNFVVGGWIPEGQAPFFVTVLLVIVFTSALLAVLNHLKILPFIIKYVGGVLSKITGLPKVESFNAVNSVFFGQSEALLAIKNSITTMNTNRLFIVCVSAMASVSASIVASYMTMIPPKYVLVALMLNMFSGLIVASMVAPAKKEDIEDGDVELDELVTSDNVFDAVATGALDGGKVALIVSAMLIAYLGLLAMINGIFTGLIGIDLTTILGYILSPVALLMGIPFNEIVEVGGVMATKIIANEFVAIAQLMPMLDTLSEKAIGITSVFVTSFAAIGSIGIIGGSIQAINGAKAKEVSKFGLKMLLVATMASTLSGIIVGFFL